MQFRKDINGLRALAVIGVVLFHFNADWMPGGYAGVDVFFVISGFLMTGIIFRGIQQNFFSISKFYVARANRIVPALATLCLVLLVFGWFCLTTIEYQTLAKHAASSIGFLSNFTYWKEAGYFDAASHEKWLLHTWSLSAEWQFYMLYPLALVTLHRLISLQSLRITILIGTFIGFGFCVFATHKWPDPSYYLLPTRAWEMMLGGVAYLYPLNIRENKRKLLEWFGLILIAGSYLFISNESPWPGYLALFPVLGSFLVIQAQNKDSGITGNLVFQKLGTWSYSIYLWHWPLVVAVYYFSLGEAFIYIGIIASVFFGFVSSKYIESIRFSTRFQTAFSYCKCVPLRLIILVGILAVAVYEYAPHRPSRAIPDTVLKSMKNKIYPCFNTKNLHKESTPFCTIRPGEEFKLFTFGDSHAHAALAVMDKIANTNGISITYAGYNGCPPLLGVYPIRADQDYKNCNLLNQKVARYVIENNFDYVFLTARWTYYTEGKYSGRGIQYLSLEKSGKKNKDHTIAAFKSGVESTFKIYSESGVRVVLMLQAPMQNANPDKIYDHALIGSGISMRLLNKYSISTMKHRKFQHKTNKILITEAKKYNNIIVLDPINHLCNETSCPVGNTITSFYRDDDHISPAGSYKLEPLIRMGLQ